MTEISDRFNLYVFVTIATLCATFTVLAISEELDSASTTYTYYSDAQQTESTSYSLTVGKYHYVDECTWSVDGKMFKEWNTSPDGTGRPYYPCQEIQVEGPIVFYAIYIDAPAGTKTVTYHVNGGTGTWNYRATDDYVFIGQDCCVRLLGDRLELTFPLGASHVVLQNRLTCSSKIFDSWNLLSTGTARTYLPGATMTLTDNVDLYAIWKDISVNVGPGAEKTEYLDLLQKILKNSSGDSALDSPNASGEIDSRTVGEVSPTLYIGTDSIQQALLTQLKTFTSDFVIVENDAINTQYDPSGESTSIKITEDTIWVLTGTYQMEKDLVISEGKILIVDSANGMPQILRSGKDVGNSTNYNFVAWYTTPYDPDATVQGSERITPDTVLTTTRNAYPYFTTQTVIDVTFHFPEDWVGYQDYTMKYIVGSKYDALLSCDKEKLMKETWNTKEDGTGVDITTNSTVYDSVKDLYVRTSATDTYRYTFDLNGGSVEGETDPFSVYVDANTRLGDTIYPKMVAQATKSGYEYGGLKITSVNGAVYEDYIINGDRTFAVKWVDENNAVKLTWNANTDDEVNYLDSPFYLAKGDHLESGRGLPSPTRVGYTFGGWYLVPNPSSTDVAITTDTVFSQDTNLYAKWEPVYPMTYSLFFVGSWCSVIGASLTTHSICDIQGQIGYVALPVPTVLSLSYDNSIIVQPQASLVVMGDSDTQSQISGGQVIGASHIIFPGDYQSSFDGDRTVNEYVLFCDGLVSASPLFTCNGGTVLLHEASISNVFNRIGAQLGVGTTAVDDKGGAIIATSLTGSDDTVYYPGIFLHNTVADNCAADCGGLIYGEDAAIFIGGCTLGHSGIVMQNSITSSSLQTFERSRENGISVAVNLTSFSGAYPLLYLKTCSTVIDSCTIQNIDSSDPRSDSNHLAYGVSYISGGHLLILGDTEVSNIHTTACTFFVESAYGRVSDGTYDNCGSHALGGLFTPSSGTCNFVLDGGSFESITSAQGGGLMYPRVNSSATVLGGSFSGFKCGSMGGVVQVKAGGTFKAYNAIFENCEAYPISTVNAGSSFHGGGSVISTRAHDPGSFELYNCTIKDNFCSSGSVCQVNGNGQHMTLVNCNFTNNRTMSGYGGAAYVTSGTLRILGCTFSGNSAAYGGAIANSGGNTMITDSEFRSNAATTYGGAIYCGAGLTLNSSIIKDNEAPSGSQIYKVGTSDLIVEDSTLTGGTQVEAGTIYLGRSSDTNVSRVNLVQGTVWIGPYTTASDISVSMGKIYVGDTINEHETSANGISLGSGQLYMGYNSKAEQVNLDLNNAQLWIQKEATGSILILDEEYFEKHEGTLSNIYNLTIIDGDLQTPEVRVGTISATLVDSVTIVLTISGSTSVPSTKEGISDSSVLIVPSGGWAQSPGQDATYTCTATLGSAGSGATEVRAVSDAGYYNVYLTISSASLSTSIGSLTTTGHPDPTEGETYVTTGQIGTQSYGFVKMYQSADNSAPAPTLLALPELTDPADTNKATFRGYSINGITHLIASEEHTVPYSLGIGAKATIVALWLKGNVLGDNGIYFEYDDDLKILQLAYDPEKATSSEQASDVMTEDNSARLRTFLGSEKDLVRSVSVIDIKSLPASVFSGFSSLEAATLQPGKLKNIGHDAFLGCSSTLRINDYEMDPSYTPILNSEILQDALVEAYRSTNLFLIEDITLTSTLSIEEDTTLNLNGKILSISSGGMFRLSPSTTLAVRDADPVGNGGIMIGSTIYRIGSLYNVIEDNSGIICSSVSLMSEDTPRTLLLEHIGAASSTIQLLRISDQIAGKMFIGWSTEAADLAVDYVDQGWYTLGISGSSSDLFGVYRVHGYQSTYTA